MGQSVSAKICRLCGQDCSDRPRIRDPKGRYYCRECYVVKARELELQRRARDEQAPHTDAPQRVDPANVPGADPGWSAVGDSLGDSGMHADAAAPSGLLACPGCGATLGADAVVCVECGYNTRTGHKLQTARRKPLRPKRDFSVAAGGMMAVALSPPGFALAVLAVFGILFALALGNPAVGPVYFVAVLVFTSGIGLVVLVMAFLDSILHGVATLFVPLYALVWVYVFNQNAYVKWLYFVSILSVFGLFVLAAQMPVNDFVLDDFSG